MRRSCMAMTVWLCIQGLALGGASAVEPGSIYHDGWIDLNKNGRMDPYENPKLDVERRIKDIRVTGSFEMAKIMPKATP